MITRIEALDYRCLRYVERPLGPMHVLVGPNGSGKTTFLDVIAFLGALVSDGLERAISERTTNPVDLLWSRQPGAFELAVEASIPDHLRKQLNGAGFDTVRYEVQVAVGAGSAEPEIREEKALLKTARPGAAAAREVFPEMQTPPPSILASESRGTHPVFRKAPGARGQMEIGRRGHRSRTGSLGVERLSGCRFQGGWPCGGRALRPWLTESEMLAGHKPARPKKAVEAALRHSRTVRSSALYQSLPSR